MKKIILLLPLILLFACSKQPMSLQTETIRIILGNDGNIEAFIDISSGKNYLAPGQKAPLLSIQVDGTLLAPEKMEMVDQGILMLQFEENIEAKIQTDSHPTHIRLELIDISERDQVELIVWGPYPTSINKSIGETVGIVRGDEYAIGLQALNPKTLGGFPWNDNDCMPQIDIFENDDFSDLSEEGKRYVLYRVEAAKPEDFGSTLQAYCRNRDKPRTIENWGHAAYLAPPFADGGVVGSAIALFGCPVESSLDYIGEIELKEGLPHPMIDGVWAKKSQKTSSSYMILGFGEEDIDRAIQYTKNAGMSYLYHPGPFRSWGHFPLNDQFPNGWKGLKACVNTSEKEGIHLGVHTLSNFIQPTDPYVSPIPDERLAKVGIVKLAADLNAETQEIIVDSPDLFSTDAGNSMRTVVIGKELIQYEQVSSSEPWKLLNCIRGAFGTTAAEHAQGEELGLLADHAYQVFLTNPELTMEVAETLARLYNETGIRQISFDGLEGNRSTGMGNYGEILMASTWYNKLEENIRSHYIADASRTSHYFWHIYSRMNWGEPWYAGFRESQTEYRFKNQKYFERNLMPGMLGWFLMKDETSLEDIEWMLAKAAGYNAGFGFVSNYKAFEENGMTERILQQINTWESARMKEVFSEEVRKQLRDVDKEFHLEKINKEQWYLTEIKPAIIEHNKQKRQPGEPLFSKLNFDCRQDQTLIVFIITAVDSKVQDIRLKIDNRDEILIPVSMKAGSKIKYEGGSEIYHFDNQWQQKEKWNVDPILLSAGNHSITIDCKSLEEEVSKVKLEVRIIQSGKEINNNH